MRKANVLSINEARKALKGNMLNVHSGWAGTTEQFRITTLCRSKFFKGKIDIKGKNFHYLVTEQELNQLTRYGHFENVSTVDGCTFTNRIKIVVNPKPVKTVKITLYGGFHDSAPINVIIPEDAYTRLSEGYAGIEDVLSPAQIDRMNRHFCGIDECCCGGVSRALWEKAN